MLTVKTTLKDVILLSVLLLPATMKILYDSIEVPRSVVELNLSLPEPKTVYIPQQHLVEIPTIVITPPEEYKHPAKLNSQINFIKSLDFSSNRENLNRYLTQVVKDDVACLTINAFFESRNQKEDISLVAQLYTTKNRVGRFGRNVCEVVSVVTVDENEKLVRYKCHFTWVCDGKQDLTIKKSEEDKLKKIHHLAKLVHKKKIPDPTGGADHYQKVGTNSWWSRLPRFEKLVTFEDHEFFKDNGFRGKKT